MQNDFDTYRTDTVSLLVLYWSYISHILVYISI